MSRADVEEDLKPIWHLWRRVGFTSEMADADGQVWPTAHAVCVHCQEHREYVAVARLEGTGPDLPREVWPGRCNLAPEGHPRKPVDTSWVGLSTTPAGPSFLGRMVLRAFAMALVWAAVGAWLAGLLSGWPVWVWIPTWGTLALGIGLYQAASYPKLKLKQPPKKG